MECDFAHRSLAGALGRFTIELTMTNANLVRVEGDLGIKLPEDLRQLYLDYPFPATSWARELAMPDDPDALIRLNRADSLLKSLKVSNPRNYLLIGTDGGEVSHYASLTGQLTQVFAANLESGTFVLRWPSLREWVAQLHAVDEEIKRDVANQGRRKWWQIWRTSN